MIQILGDRFARIHPLFLKTTALNVAGLGLLYLAWMYGHIQTIYEKDISKISLIMAGVFVCEIGHILFRAWRGERSENTVFLANMLVLFGLIGTVLGFIDAMTALGHGPISANSVPMIVAQLTSGMGIALNASLVGLILSAWLLINNWRVRVWLKDD